MFLRAISFLSTVLAAVAVSAEEKIDFNRDIRPILSGKCFACHGPDEAERGADLRLDTQEGSRLDMGGYAAVVPGNIDESELIYRVTTDDDSDIMPPEGKGQPLTAKEVSLLEKWIKQGGNYAKHWAYEKPVRSAVPQSAHKDWRVVNEIDSYVHRQLASKGLKPAPTADRLTLARRVSLDLIGLPPTWEEAQAFVNNPSPNAYEEYVDSLLAKPAFGERWAQVWLDLARYADSAGYADDPPRTIWGYRDWVIRAFNQNMPFDQFTIEQIAGDLLENPTDEQLIATAFHRNTLTNNEGGTNNEEFRNVAVVDRVNTTMEVWMATTMACAQCHTHKFDPLTHAEYFQMFDYFNQSEDADRRNESPLVEVWNDDQRANKLQLESELSKLNEILNSDSPAIVSSRKKWLASLKIEPEWLGLSLQESEGGDLVAAQGGWINLQGDRPKNAVFKLSFPTDDQTVSALRIAVSPKQKENFVLSQVKASWKPAKAQPLMGRYLRVELPGKKKMIHLAEVEVFSGDKNLARTAKASQSSTGYNGPAKLAIDGNTDGDFEKKSVSHTAVEDNPWFQVDLGKLVPIDSFTIWNRTGLESRLAGYVVKILDENKAVVWQDTPSGVPTPSQEFVMSGAINLNFKAAFANHEQNGFPASSVIARDLDKKSGWAIAGKVGEQNYITLALPKPIKLNKGNLTVDLVHASEHANHILTDFQIATTSDPNITEWARIPSDVQPLLKSDPEHAKVAAFYRTIASELQPTRNQLAAVDKKLKGLKAYTTVPIMRDLPSDKGRITKIHLRGSYLNTGDEVKKGVPAVFHPLPKDKPNNRLGLAHWLVDQDNPLTSRVIVNRFWERIFGIGIVETIEEFGSQGDLPTHPEMLDWLALEFQEGGWDVKALLKRMVMSSTYQQVTKSTPELVDSDPYNQFYARGPRFRISAEMVRDQALSVSGLLSNKMYGKSVNPPQPNLGLKAAFGGSTDWKTSAGEDKFRRGVYTTWRRSSPYPSMATFDAPTREVCISRRGRTNTPLQALVTLNDPVYVEAAQAFARKVLSKGGDSVEEQLAFAWRTALLRDPSDAEIKRAIALLTNVQEKYTSSPEDAKKMATEPIGAAPEGADLVELASWSVLGNVILNLDEMFLKR